MPFILPATLSEDRKRRSSMINASEASMRELPAAPGLHAGLVELMLLKADWSDAVLLLHAHHPRQHPVYPDTTSDPMHHLSHGRGCLTPRTSAPLRRAA
jgi:hypothetical protein